MASAALKSISQCIKQENYEQAEREIQALDKPGNKNVLVYLFGIVVSNKLGKQSTALNYLNKARDVDEKNPEVNKAECAIYERFPELITKRNINVLDLVIDDVKVPEERRISLKKIRLLAYLRLRFFTQFAEDSDLEKGLEDFEVAELVLKVTKAGEKIPVEISKKAFLSSKDQLKKAEHSYGLMLFQSADQKQFLELVFDHIRRFGCDDAQIFKFAYTDLAVSLIDKHLIPEHYQEIIRDDHFYPSNKKLSDWLRSLLDGDVPQAYDKLLNLSIDNYGTWPLCGMALYTFLAARQFNRVLALYRMKKTVFNSLGAEAVFRTMEVEASFENYGDLSELRQLVRNLENNKEFDANARILEVYLRMKILIGSATVEEIESSKLPELVKKELLAEFYFSKSEFTEADKLSRKVLDEDSARWRARLMQLRVEWKATESPDDVVDEVRAFYGQNPFVADILVFLAEIYLELDELPYAKQIIDHAVKVTPSRQAFRELQDKIYAKTDVPIEERIDNLNHYVSLKPYCMWAVRHSTVLEIQNGRFDEAVSKLKRVIHAIPDYVDTEVKTGAAAIWGYVGLVNFHRGQFLSTMYAFESAVSLEEDNPNYLFLLALSQRNIYHFDKVFGTLKKLRAVSASPVIRKLAHELFLETIILFATDMTPGRLQIHQLLTFYKIIGNMKTSDWISSKVLSFSIASSLTLLRKYNTTIVDAILNEVSEFSTKFGIVDKNSAFEAEIAIMLSLLRNDDHVGVLNEAGLRILDYAFDKKSAKFGSISRRFFRKAILSPNGDSVYRSYLFVNLALTYCVDKVDHKRAIHCVLRALQLFKNNATALSLLGFLMLGTDDFANAKNAFNNAHILEPEQMNHWCGRAVLGELDGSLTEAEVMNNYQHSLTIRPCRQAIESFVCRLIEAKSKKESISRNIFFDYKSVSHLSYLYEKADEIGYSLSMIAEHFRHFDEAAFLIGQIPSTSSIAGLELAKMRIYSASRKDGTDSDNRLTRLKQIYHGSLSEAIAASGEKLSTLVRFLLSSLGADDWRLFWKFYRSKFYPLLVSLINLLNLSSVWGKGIHSTIREGRPQHKLLEVFPAVTPRNEYAAMRRPKEDENAFVRYDPAIEPLYELLKKLKKEYEATLTEPVEDDFVVMLPVEDNSDDLEEMD